MNIPPKVILVPTDFSEPADAALDYAIALADEIGAQITVLHAYEIPILGFPDGALVATADFVGRIVAGSQAALDAIVAKRKNRGVVLKSLLKSGEPRETIHAVATDLCADLIVMGTHGRRGLSRALLGSVAEYVVRTASLPVLTIRGTSKAESKAEKP